MNVSKESYEKIKKLQETINSFDETDIENHKIQEIIYTIKIMINYIKL